MAAAWRPVRRHPCVDCRTDRVHAASDQRPPTADGGILNPVPIAPTLQDPTDAIIAVSLSGVPQTRGGSSRRSRTEYNRKPRHRLLSEDQAFIDQLQARLGLHDEATTDRQSLSLTDAALLSLDAMQASIARCMLAAYPPDVLIEIPIDTCVPHEFYRAAEVIEAGEYWAEREIERPTNKNGNPRGVSRRPGFFHANRCAAASPGRPLKRAAVLPGRQSSLSGNAQTDRPPEVHPASGA